MSVWQPALLCLLSPLSSDDPEWGTAGRAALSNSPCGTLTPNTGTFESRHPLNQGIPRVGHPVNQGTPKPRNPRNEGLRNS